MTLPGLLFRRHVPWIVPHEFFDELPPWQDLPLASDPYAPWGMPDAAWHYPADVTEMDIEFNGTCNATRSKLYRRAYYAATAFQDYNVGAVLSTLDELELTNSTLTVLLGDHGWNLGEHDLWAKFNLFETGAHIPLIIRAPWLPHSVGQHTDVLAEAVDLYPTMAALCGLPPPQEFAQEVNGTNLAPLFAQPPAPGSGSALKPAAYSQFGKCAAYEQAKTNFTLQNLCRRDQMFMMGFSVRTDLWRYTCWFGVDDVGDDEIAVATDRIIGRELYDHRRDAGGASFDRDGENVNLVVEPRFAEIVARHHALVLGYIRPRVRAEKAP